MTGYVRNRFKEEFTSANYRQTLNFLWVYDFPLFEHTLDGIKSCHHPFTMPHLDDLENFQEITASLSKQLNESSEASKLYADLLGVRSQAYDLVCNGVELGGNVRFDLCWM